MNATRLKHISIDTKVLSVIILALSTSACGSGFKARQANGFVASQNDPGLIQSYYKLADVGGVQSPDDQAGADDSDRENNSDDEGGSDDDKSQVQTPQFKIEGLSDQQQQKIADHFKYIDPQHQIDRSLLKKALAFFFVNQSHLTNSKVLTVVDFSLPSSEKRLFVINTQNGQMWSTYVAHGSGSDKDRDGIAEGFSNRVNSNATSIGPYLTLSTYSGEHGTSLRLQGLAPTNSNAFKRNIVVHGADYVHDQPILQGRSWGCLAVNPKYVPKFVSLIKGGSLIYSGLSNPSAAHEF